MLAKAMAYIDGFSLYFGLKEMGWSRYYWLNVKALCENFAKPPRCRLEGVKYFTSRIKGGPSKAARQDAFIRALKTVPGIEIKWGKYGTKGYKCKKCQYDGELHAEKMTDVYIASEMIIDASHNNYDIAYLISGDKDLVPAIKTIKDIFPARYIVLIPPPMRYCPDLAEVAHVTLNMWEHYLRKSQFPSTITRTKGAPLVRPQPWA
jgi:hypothetical protein